MSLGLNLSGESMAALTGIPLFGSELVSEGQLLKVVNPTTGRAEIWFHDRISRRQRHRRPHGRPRNAPRRMKERRVRYHPDLDLLKEVAR